MGRWTNTRFTLQPSWAAWALGVLGVCVGIFALVVRDRWRPAPSLQIGIIGCVIDFIDLQEPVCEIYQTDVDQRLRVAVDTTAEALVRVDTESQDGLWRSETQLRQPTSTNESGSINFSIVIPNKSVALSISATHAQNHNQIGQKRIILRRISVSEFDREVLQAARNYESPAKRQQILDKLDTRLRKATVPDEQLKLLVYIIGLMQAYRTKDLTLYGSLPDTNERKILSLIETAMTLAKQTKRIATFAHVLAFKFEVLRNRPDEQTLTAELIDALKIVAPIAKERIEILRELGELSESGKDLRSAIDYFNQAVNAAEWIGEADLSMRMRNRLHRLMAGLGRDVAHSVQEDERLAWAHRDPCIGSRLLHNIAWLQLLNWERDPSSDKFSDPLPLLRKLIARSRVGGACPDLKRVRVVAASLARRLSVLPLDDGKRQAATTESWRKEIVSAIAEASVGIQDGHQQVNLEQDLLFARARLAVFDRNLRTAQLLFLQLSKLTKDSAPIDSQWEAVCGAATAQLLVEQTQSLPTPLQIEQKRALLRTCTDVLEESADHIRATDHARAMDVRRTMVKRFTSVLFTRDDQAHLPTIMEALRGINRLAVASHRSPRGAALSEPIRKQIEDYWQRRREFEQRLETLWSKLSTDRATAEQRRKEREQLLDLYESIMNAFRQDRSQAAAWQTLPELPTDELVLLCQSEGAEVLCISQLGTQLKSKRVPHSADEVKLAEQVLVDWKDVLSSQGKQRRPTPKVRRVRVLSTGGLTHGDVAHWPLDGEHLIARIPVVFSLDIVPLPEQERRSSVVFALHPSGDLGRADEMIGLVEKNLTASRLPLRFLSADVHNPPHVQLNKSPLFEPTMSAHNQALLLGVLGHFAPTLCSSDPAPFGATDSPWLRALCLPYGNSIWPTDILLSQSVPRIVLLLGCSAGKADRSVSTSTMTLASSYVLRGSRAVLSATDDLPQALAQETMCYMTREPQLLSDDFDLPAALQRTQNSLRQGKSCTGKYDQATVASLPWQMLRVTIP